MPEICGAKKSDGGTCHAAAMPNGRCYFHGGPSTGPHTPFTKHGLYRKRLTAAEQELYDFEMANGEFDSLRREIAMVRVVIDRCFSNIMDPSDENWRVPIQVMPQYIEKLLKLVERMKPQAAPIVHEETIDDKLDKMFRSEADARQRAKLN